jgi:hypothetical protein
MARLRQVGVGRYVVADPAAGYVVTGVGGVAAVLWLVATPGQRGAWQGLWLVPALLAGYALTLLVLRSRLELDLTARRYAWRSSRWFGSRPLGGDLDRDVRGLRVAPKPCGRRRACRAGWGIYLVFRTSLGEHELDVWPVAEEAQAQARVWAAELGLPLLEERPS